MQRDDIFLATLLEINDEIKKQIPLSPNHYDKFERLSISEKLSAEEIKLHEEAVKNSFQEHKNEYLAEKKKYHVYQYLNTEFKKFLEEEKIITPQAMTKEDKKKFSAQVKLYSVRFFNEIEAMQKILKEGNSLDTESMRQYFSDTMDFLIEKLCQGEILCLENEDAENRYKKADLLARHRTIGCKQLFVSGPQLMPSEQESSPSEHIKLIKAAYFAYAVYIDRAQVNVGQCNEFMCLGLKKIYEHHLVKEKTKIEVITIDYENGEDHTFLAIDRDENSQLSDISSWGNRAYLFDAWNNFVCKASDFSALPYYYFTYSSNEQWKSIVTYDVNDRLLLSNLTYIDKCFYVTDNTEQEQRNALLMEEYELISLDNHALYQIKDYLSQILKKSLPLEFNYSVELFLTTAGNRPVTAINGFSEPKIAIHLDLFNGQNSFSQNELEFGITRTLFFIKHFPLANEDCISRAEHFYLDRLAIDQYKDGPQAINYLRKCLQFETTTDYSAGFYSLQRSSSSGMGYQHRIKNLNNLLALDETFRIMDVTHPIPSAVLMEAEKAKIGKECFFETEFNKHKSKHKQINYLTSQLHELKIELFPYEFTKKPGKRLKDFCHLLNRIEINLQDRDQAQAVDELINVAFSLRIAGFDYLYRSVMGDHDLNRASLPALGPFKNFQMAITAFISADSDELIRLAASEMQAWETRLEDHFEHCLSHQTGLEPYIKKYQEKHPNDLPRGQDRYFGSTIAHCVAWSGFPKNSFNSPWNNHLIAAKKDPTNLIANALWRLGVRDKSLWPKFSIHELLQMINRKSGLYRPPLVKLREFNDYTTEKEILKFCSENHQLQINMFESPSMSFEEMYIQFFDNNLPALIAPRRGYNEDNAAVKFLLRQFYLIAIKGSETDQQVVKSFFLGRNDKRDLLHLLSGVLEHTALNYSMPYTKFIKDQRFEDLEFQLFTKVDLLRFIDYIDPSWEDEPAPPAWYISVFSLPHEELTLSCLEQLIPLLRTKSAFYLKMSKMIQYHLYQYGPYPLFSHEAAVIAQIVSINFVGPYESTTRKEILRSLKWPKSLTNNDLASMHANDLITLYRSYDINFLFPSNLEQDELGNLLLEKIKMIPDHAQQLLLVEDLLFTNDAFLVPISGLRLRNAAIEQWLDAAIILFGKDDNSDEYFDQLRKIIDHLNKGVSNRDLGYMLNLLANTIESQKSVSDYIGVTLEPDKYSVLIDKKNYSRGIIDMLSDLSSYLGKDKQDQKKFLDFLSSSLTPTSRDDFSSYIYHHPKSREIAKRLGYDQGFDKLDLNACEQLTQLIYNMFWGCSLEQRALIINYLLLPAETAVDEKAHSLAYEDAFIYVSNKLFPDAEVINSDDNIAVAFLKAYLEVADEYTRGYLLAALLVTSCESEEAGQKPSIGKKIALLCEHMGPAYVKLAQAIHSHPQTPENIRRDLSHLKGRASPPTRWHLWRIMNEVLPTKELSKISYLGCLLGSASYNFALRIELTSGEKLVLLLLRENAEKNARQGFSHLRATIIACPHEKVAAYRSVFLSMLEEAAELSALEINSECGDRQSKIATDIYHLTMTAEINHTLYKLNIFPSKSVFSGNGYRFIEEVIGTEFNDLPTSSDYEKAICQSVAQSILTTELINILSADNFDCDRHGNQLRVLVDPENLLIHVGLYDFGEMSLDKPTIQEVLHLKNVIRDFPSAFLKGHTFDQIISDNIDKVLQSEENPRYLMRIRKAFLALQDFQKYLSPQDLLKVMTDVNKSNRLSPLLRIEFAKSIFLANSFYSGASKIKNALDFFNNKLTFFMHSANQFTASPRIGLSSQDTDSVKNDQVAHSGNPKCT